MRLDNRRRARYARTLLFIADSVAGKRRENFPLCPFFSGSRDAGHAIWRHQQKRPSLSPSQQFHHSPHAVQPAPDDTPAAVAPFDGLAAGDIQGVTLVVYDANGTLWAVADLDDDVSELYEDDNAASTTAMRRRR